MDKRRDRRVAVKDAVSVGGKGAPKQGTIINLSVNGCAFQSGQPIDPDVPIQLELCIPNQKDPLKVHHARLSWKAGTTMGVQFLNMNETTKARLQQYIESLPQESPKQG